MANTVDTKKETVKVEAVKAEPVKAVATKVEAPKAAAKKPAAKKPAAKKAAPKAAAKKPAAKKAAPKAAAKKPAAKKAPAKKVTPAAKKVDVVVQGAAGEWKLADVEKKVIKATGKVSKAVTIYVKPDEGMAYYVADGDNGAVQL